MRFSIFADNVQREVEKVVTNRFGEGLVLVRDVVKNNGVKMKAISIRRKGDNTTPTIYLESFYDEYKRGSSIRDICTNIVEIYANSLNSFDFDIREFVEFEKVKEKVLFKLINYDMNKKMLEDSPHFKVLDMAITFYVLVSHDETKQASAMINNQHIEAWGIDKELLKKIALENTQRRYPAVIQKMEDIIAEMIMGDIGQSDEEGVVKEDCVYGDMDYTYVENIIREEINKIKIDKEMEMYVLTNHERCNGAACILYPNVLKNFAIEQDCDIYIIPSSIHEVILIPGEKWSKDFINEMIMDVNNTELDMEEILSNHVYIYSKDHDKIHI